MIAKVQYFIQTRSITKTINSEWFDLLGPYKTKDEAVENTKILKPNSPRDLRIISRTDEVLETVKAG